MKLNQGGLRDLFRYFLACISSFSIIIYVIFSTIGIFFPKENHSTINDIFMQNKDDRIIGKWKTILGYWWNIENIEKPFYVRQKYKQEDNISDIRNTTNNINQSLQNGNIFDERLIMSEEGEYNENNIQWNKFDIEKIISDLHLQKEKRVAVVAKDLWIDWKNEKLDYAKLAWIDWTYNWSLDQNQKIRNYLIANAQAIYKDKHWWNEWDTLPLVSKEEKEVKMNTKEITWQVTYNDVTLKVSAPAESFPEWTVLRIKTLGDEDSTTTFDITFKEVILMTQVDKVEYDAPMVSFDISFYAPDDTEFIEELQPAEWKTVSVTFDYANNKEFKDSENEWFLAIYHMEDNDETSVANLVSTKDSGWNSTKSDSMNIYANTLSVYILTVVSDFDEESEGTETIKFDAGYGGFIVENEDIVLASTWTEIDAVYTWKILAKNNEIILPEVKLSSWYNFWWWYYGNIFLWKPWSVFKVWNNNSDSKNPDLTIEESKNFEIYACLYIEWSTGKICTLNENWNSDSDIIDSSENHERDTNTEAYTLSEDEIEKYGEDVFVAYNWAINKWITTIDDVSKVEFNKKITRAELAKMMVVFMSWTFQKEPLLTWEVNYKDVDSEKLGDLAWYIQLAYQYQIMGIKADWAPTEKFNPDKTVTRAEFVTVLSRVLFGNTYNQGWVKYYEKHIEALENANILSNANPDLVEARWRIMTMLYNTQNNITTSDN